MITKKLLISKKEVFAEYKKIGIAINYDKFMLNEINLIFKILKIKKSSFKKRIAIEAQAGNFIFSIFDILEGKININLFEKYATGYKLALKQVKLSDKEIDFIFRQISFDIGIFLKSIKKLNYNSDNKHCIGF